MFIFINLEKVFITYEIIKDIIIGKVIVFNIIKISFMKKNDFEKKKRIIVIKAKLINLKLIYNDYYNLKEFVDNVKNDLNNRCGYCYLSRLESAFKYASSNGYDCVTTTLLISPYQKHDLIIRTCEFLEKKYNVKFLYRDFRPYFYEGKAMFKETGLYMQKYCGCVFSEEERYEKKIKKNTGLYE